MSVAYPDISFQEPAQALTNPKPWCLIPPPKKGSPENQEGLMIACTFSRVLSSASSWDDRQRAMTTLNPKPLMRPPEISAGEAHQEVEQGLEAIGADRGRV